MKSTWRVDASLVGVALIWGSTFVLVKQALDDISTLLFLTLRFTFAALALGILFWNKVKSDLNQPGVLWPSLRAGSIAGICLFAGYVFQTFGLKYTTAAKAGFLTGLYIPLVPVIGAALYRKLPQPSEILGVAFAFAGMALMTVESSFLSIGIGDFLVMCCAVAYAFHILALGHFAQRVNVPVLTVMQIATAALLGAVSFPWAEPVKVKWSLGVWVALAVTSLLATALAFGVQTWAQQYTSPTRTALIFATEPVFAWVTSFVVLGEVLSGRAVSGACLILAGIVLVDLKPFGLPRHPPPGHPSERE